MATNMMSTPVNMITRENLTILIRNNVLNDSVEFLSECDSSMMEADSPLRKPSHQQVNKKLFHSPLSENSLNKAPCTRAERNRKAAKRKQVLLPDSCEKIKRAYVRECEEDGYSPAVHGGIRKKVLISLFHNKEYSMDCSG